MNKTKRWLCWIPALLLLVAPAVAHASPGPVGQLLQGPTVDPLAASFVHISAPSGGYVMVQRDGRLIGFVRGTQSLSARPGQRLRLAAVRGATLLSSLTVVVRAGQTAVSWPRGVPAVRYRPILTPAPQRVAPRRVRATNPTLAPHRYNQLQRRLRIARSDRQRLSILRPYIGRYRFHGWQVRSVVANFRSKASRTRARLWLIGSARKKAATARASSQRLRRVPVAKHHRLQIRARSGGRIRRIRQRS